MTPDQRRLSQLLDLHKRIEGELRRVSKIVAAESPKRRRVAECGTESGYQRHRRTLRDTPCDACKEAHSTYESHRAYRAKLRALGVA